MIRHIFLRLVRNAVSVKRVIVLHPILFFYMKVRKNERFQKDKSHENLSFFHSFISKQYNTPNIGLLVINNILYLYNIYIYEFFKHRQYPP